MGSVTHLSSVASRSETSLCKDPTADSEIADVLAEIAAMMGAEGAVLSLHSDQAAFELLGACVPESLTPDILTLIGDARLSHFVQSQPVDPEWSQVVLGTDVIDILMLPVSPVDAYSRLVASVLFRRPTRQTRQAAERLFATRQPLAMGYFRLWQLDRARSRRFAALEAACDVTDCGMMFFTADGTVTFTNAAAANLLDIGDGLRRHRGSVHASDIADSVKLQVALNHAMAANGAGDGSASVLRRAPLVRLHRRQGEPLVAVIVAAERRAVHHDDVAVMMYLFDPSFDMDRLLKPICHAFKLSPVETQLACQLATGRSLADASAALRIKEQTARGYLKHVFVKTDTRRQSELVHLMLSNVLRLGRTIVPEFL